MSLYRKLLKNSKDFASDFWAFLLAYFLFFKELTLTFFEWFEKIKNFFSSLLYRQRGRFSQPFAHFWLALFLFLGIALSPSIEASLHGQDFEWSAYSPSSALATYSEMGQSMMTIESSRSRGEIINYTIRSGDTVASIAKKFGVSIDTVIWANKVKSVTKIKAGERIKIPPVTGIVHRVQRGETVYSIAKKYQASPQPIVDFPFNSFADDENFTLAVGQTLIVPEGIMPKAKPVSRQYLARRQVQIGASLPSEALAKEGQFIWPASGRITQRYSWYHRAIDIANKSAPAIVVAAAGRVVATIYSRVGYGNHVVIDHGNGYQTLYAHLSKIYVKNGQALSAGQSIGQMGSTGRSTGTHLHFEIIKNGVKLNPLTVLK